MASPADKNGDGSDANSTETHKAIRSRLSELDERLERVKARHSRPEEANRRGNAIGYAFRLTVELVVGLVVGGFLGWWVDYLLGTTPVFLLIFFVLGMAAGILNVMKTARSMQSEQAKMAADAGVADKADYDEDD